MKPYKGLRPGEQVSARAYTAVERFIAGAHGTGSARVSTVNGCMQVHVPPLDTSHPFKISADFDDDTSPTVCLVTIGNGFLQGHVKSGGSYVGKPLFEGSGGSELDADPIPSYNVGVTARINYLYLVVNTDVYGLIDTVYIEHLVPGDLPAPEIEYVQPGVPLSSDTGTAGRYYWLVGTVTVSETAGVYSLSISQAVNSNLGFYTCGGEGRFFRA